MSASPAAGVYSLENKSILKYIIYIYYIPLDIDDIGFVVYHVTIVGIGRGLLKKCWLYGNRLRSTQGK